MGTHITLCPSAVCFPPGEEMALLEAVRMKGGRDGGGSRGEGVSATCVGSGPV